MNKPAGTDPLLTPAEYQAVLRQDLGAFIQRCFYELVPQAPFLWNWHLEILAAKLAAVQRGEVRRLIINIAPRHLKSLCASIALPAWWLGHDPAAQILCVSYAQDLADKLSRDARAVMNTSWYQEVFSTRLSSDKNSVQEFVTTAQGFRLATSVGGVLTGRGADLIIIDDPLKPDEAVSEVQRKKVNEWYDNTLYSRLNDKQYGRIILIMQRLHEEDLVGRVLNQEGWEVVSFPAIAEKDEEYAVDTVFGAFRHRRRAGDPLHPERESRETLERIRRTIGEYNFAGQYQQAPAPLGGGIVKESYFKRYGPEDLPDSWDQVIQSWDTANKATELSDYSVCTTWGIKQERIYLRHVLRKRMGYPDLKRAVREQWNAFTPGVILIEDKASGTQLIQELLEEGVHAVTRFNPEYDKVMRMHAQTGVIENGFVYLPKAAHWLPEYLHELAMFPNGKFDDQVDSTSQALSWTKRRPAGWGLSEYYRREIEKSRKGAGPAVMVTLKPPTVTSTLYTIDGRQVCSRSDGTFNLELEDAKPLLAAGWQQIPKAT
jgi:predicted phage terminase large subunit-like protein